MSKIKKILIFTLLLAEVVIFGLVYLFGNHGIKQLRAMQKENQDLQLEVDNLKLDLARLEEQLSLWESDAFYKEKIARERLHLSRSNEQVYHLV